MLGDHMQRSKSVSPSTRCPFRWPALELSLRAAGLKATQGSDETALVAARPGAWPAGQAAGRLSEDQDRQDDLTRSDWWGAEQRRAGSFGTAPGLGVNRGEDPAKVPDLRLATGNAALGLAPTKLAPTEFAPTGLAAAAPRRRGGWVQLTRLWALAKVASMAYTTWWAMGYVHAGLGTIVSAYGAVCLFAGFGARWRKRFFGPGQLIEPEVYEEIGRWFYRLGVALVLVGGVAVTAQYVTR